MTEGRNMNRSQEEMARLAQYIKETSAPDARGTRPAYYADLRDGGLIEDEKRPAWFYWAIILSAALLCATIAVETMPDMPVPAQGLGYEYCRGKC